MAFQLAACAEMLWRDRPIEWRCARLHEMGFAVGLWNWPDHDLDRLIASGATFSIMNGYLSGRLADEEVLGHRQAREHFAALRDVADAVAGHLVRRQLADGVGGPLPHALEVELAEVLQEIIPLAGDYPGLGGPLVLAGLEYRSPAKDEAIRALLAWPVNLWPPQAGDRLRLALKHNTSTREALKEALQKLPHKE